MSALLERPAPGSRLSVPQYHALIAGGILTENDNVELLDGQLVAKMPKNRRHGFFNELIANLMAGILPDGWHTENQQAITLATGEPEPDVLVLRGGLADYTVNHPVAADLGLVVEVSDTTLRTDRGVKLAQYASAGIPVYWIVNLIDNRVEIYSQPAGQAYGLCEVKGFNEPIDVVLDGKAIGSIRLEDGV